MKYFFYGICSYLLLNILAFVVIGIEGDLILYAAQLLSGAAVSAAVLRVRYGEKAEIRGNVKKALLYFFGKDSVTVILMLIILYLYMANHWEDSVTKFLMPDYADVYIPAQTFLYFFFITYEGPFVIFLTFVFYRLLQSFYIMQRESQ